MNPLIYTHTLKGLTSPGILLYKKIDDQSAKSKKTLTI